MASLVNPDLRIYRLFGINHRRRSLLITVDGVTAMACVTRKLRRWLLRQRGSPGDGCDGDSFFDHTINISSLLLQTGDGSDDTPVIWWSSCCRGRETAARTCRRSGEASAAVEMTIDVQASACSRSAMVAAGGAA